MILLHPCESARHPKRPPNGPRISCGDSSAARKTYVSLRPTSRQLHALVRRCGAIREHQGNVNSTWVVSTGVPIGANVRSAARLSSVAAPGVAAAALG